jgi:3-phenylpropionate/cinnamic acid dioxygenase small subunit
MSARPATGHLSAERQILNLLHRYAEYVDAADFEAVGELFEGAEYQIRGALHGHEVTEAMQRSVKLHDGQIRTKHVLSNTILEFHHGDAERNDASARSYFTVLQATDSLALQPIVCGRYLDTFRDDGLGTDSSWRFATRTIVLDLVGNMNEHLVRPIPTEPS